MKKIIFTLFLFPFLTQVDAQIFDTTGVSANWKSLNNSYNTWTIGAFDTYRDPNNQADFGWGDYDVTSHIIKGDSIYIIKTVNDNYKAISIDQLASGVFTITYSDLDGTNRNAKTFDKSNYQNRNFIYFSIDNELTKDLEPNTEDWDIVFRKFLTVFPGFGTYPVSGVLSNIDVETSKVEFVPNGTYSSSDTSNFPMSGNISTIGYDWKNSFAGITYDTLVYYVLNQTGNLNELKFIDYSGSGTGVYKFEVNGVLDSVVLGVGNTDQVYYSLENKARVKTNQDNDWDIALFAPTSFSSVPVRINDANGAKLYVYPNKDIGHWNSIGLNAPKNINLISAFPNPASDHITLVLNSKSNEILNLTIVDQSGRIIKNKNLELKPGFEEYQMDLNAISQGIYFLKITSDNYSEITRLVVQP